MPPGVKGFQKGVATNPLGRGAEKNMRLRKMTHEEIADIGSLILSGNLEALQAVPKDPNSSTLRVWFASIAMTAIKKGDASSLSIILDRLVGRPKAQVEISGTLNTKQYTPEEARERFKELQERLASRITDEAPSNSE